MSRSAGALKIAELHVPSIPLVARPTHKLHLVPPPKPKARTKPRCVEANGKCANIIRFQIDRDYYCSKHAEEFWNTHFVENHRVRRVGQITYEA